jgi:hypothetical protein
LPILSPSASTMIRSCQLRTVSMSGMCVLLVRGLAGVTDLGQPGERGDAPGAPPGPICCQRPGTRST